MQNAGSESLRSLAHSFTASCTELSTEAVEEFGESFRSELASPIAPRSSQKMVSR
ncbi:hypothetical protein SAMN04487965_0465 [Microbulbifer donghaiensis]|uniref:Uncharacterized protein n=1 Tax=Microbulbifer donghaiensis TaxID=494016 RepID=A0A1M4VLZ5_9GAMM|nr:hypothetical protein SAMN04487965_0465 [Microbulbifer donghaiensis]